MTRLICTEVPLIMNPGPGRLYMYAPNCWSANPLVAMQFHVEGAARAVGDLCHCHEGTYIWDADTEEVVYRWGVYEKEPIPSRVHGAQQEEGGNDGE